MNFAKMGSGPEKKVAPARVSWNGHGKAGALAKEVVVVAINASKGVTGHALEWALKNVVQPGDSIFLLVLLPPVSPGWKFWQVSHTDSVTKDRKRLQETKKSCQIVLEKLHSLSGAKKVHATVKIIPGAVKGVASREAKNLSATWVLLDRSLKNEEKACSEELQCNLVIVKRQNAKVLRLNLKHSPPPKTINLADSKFFQTAVEREATPSASPDVEAPFTPTDNGTPTSSSTSPFSSAEPNNLTSSALSNSCLAAESGFITESDTDDSSCGRTSRRSNCVDYGTQGKQRNGHERSSSRQLSSTISRLSLSMREVGTHQSPQTSLKSATAMGGLSPRLILSDFLTSLRRMDSKKQETRRHLNLEESMQTRDHTSVRTAVSLSSHAPLGPPPLCSICQHKAPAFGRPPRAFTYQELERATGGFSQANFLAEGGFGSVHRGVLPEGQVVAVKQHKLASSQGDVEFCSEVEVLSCAQHRNVVMLIGYCTQDSRRLLVYEFICNGSLDSHLYGRNKAPLEWRHRRKIAVGAARGLRYLHEECRVGCIVHRDLRPNNVLLTHDYEPMVGDFGLARWQPDGELGVETRVIGTFGYLAPEYTQSGQITEKADVYSFGVVLLELVTGRKAIDINRPKGQQCLSEWARLLLRKGASFDEFVDPRLEGCYDSNELEFMVHAASLCISRDPDTRPRMSQVLRMLEGDLALGERSGRLSFDAGSSTRAASSSMRQAERRSVSAAGTRSSNRLCAKSSSSSSSSSAAAMSSGRSLTLEELKAAYRSRMQSRKLWYDGGV